MIRKEKRTRCISRWGAVFSQDKRSWSVAKFHIVVARHWSWLILHDPIEIWFRSWVFCPSAQRLLSSEKGNLDEYVFDLGYFQVMNDIALTHDSVWNIVYFGTYKDSCECSRVHNDSCKCLRAWWFITQRNCMRGILSWREEWDSIIRRGVREDFKQICHSWARVDEKIAQRSHSWCSSRRSADLY